MKKIRSMRDIPRFQGPTRRPTTSSREQTASELARLEHEKARLERELQIWMNNQQRTSERLRLVEQRLALLHQTLQQGNAGATLGAQHRVSRPDEPPHGWCEISLEY